MQAVGQNVLIKPFSSENISEGGIILADSYKPKRKDKGLVVSVGNGSTEKPMLIPKDVVCYHIKGAGVEFEENGETFVVVQQRDILAYELN